MLHPIIEQALASPATIIGAILAVIVNVKSPIDKDFELFKRVYKSIFAFFTVFIFVVPLTYINFSFSQLLNEPLSNHELAVIGGVMLVFSALSPFLWLVNGRNNLKENLMHFLSNGLGAGMAFVSVVIFNRLPTNQISSTYHGTLFIFEILVISLAFFVQFSFESRVEHQSEANKQNKIAPIANALWCSVAMSIYCITLLYTIGSFGIDADFIIWGYVDIRLISLILSASFLTLYLFTAIGDFQKSLFPVYLIGLIGVTILIMAVLYSLPPDTMVSNFRTWLLLIVVGCFIFILQYFLKGIRSTNLRLWDRWSVFVTASFMFPMIAASDVWRLYEISQVW